MWIPRYWAKGWGEVQHSYNAELVRTEAWGWSDDSEAAAQRVAEERATRIASSLAGDAIPASWYDYMDRPVREEIVEDRSWGIITRNAQGALVLNCASAMFIDVDRFSSKHWFGRFFSGLFDGNKVLRGAPEISLLRSFAADHKDWCFRVYKTYAGYRYLVTHQQFDPTSEETHSVMNAVGADKRYVHLCRGQRCFRARLTPKPWRCGLESPLHRFPFELDTERSEMRLWLDRYERAISRYATASLIEVIGSRVAQKIDEVVQLHDEWCKVGSDLPLA
ncbi:hypothetical protein [Mucisphaera sp.]|uniref:hypothetical protein n=1 Tax=Mucisphaera sp. TaxID=2913024 RepID=UPI003D114BEC